MSEPTKLADKILRKVAASPSTVAELNRATGSPAHEALKASLRRLVKSGRLTRERKRVGTRSHPLVYVYRMPDAGWTTKKPLFGAGMKRRRENGAA